MSRKRKTPLVQAVEEDEDVQAFIRSLQEQMVDNLSSLPIEEPLPKRLEKSPPIYDLQDLITIGSTNIDYRNIDSKMLRKITPHLKDLLKMIGLKSTKETIFGQVAYYLQGMHKKVASIADDDGSVRIGNYLHTMICGSPGSGKTEVAKIIAKIYQTSGILSKDGPFKIAHRDDFIGKYVGHTAIKTRELLESCIGGVLFIDEAYSISGDVFTKEAIDTLTAFLSEHKDNFCCIIAGYENDLRKCLFEANQGLERRFPWVHKVDEYTTEDLTAIFMQMIDKIGWGVAKPLVNTVISANKTMFKHNGGSIETFIDKMKIIHAKRVINMDESERFAFTKEDLDATVKAVKEMEAEKNISHLMFYT